MMNVDGLRAEMDLSLHYKEPFEKGDFKCMLDVSKLSINEHDDSISKHTLFVLDGGGVIPPMSAVTYNDDEYVVVHTAFTDNLKQVIFCQSMSYFATKMCEKDGISVDMISGGYRASNQDARHIVKYDEYYVLIATDKTHSLLSGYPHISVKMADFKARELVVFAKQDENFQDWWDFYLKGEGLI